MIAGKPNRASRSFDEVSANIIRSWKRAERQAAGIFQTHRSKTWKGTAAVWLGKVNR